MSLPESLERAASEMDGLADKIRPANGDPHRLLGELDASEASALLVWMLSADPDSAAELIEDWGEADEGAAILATIPDDGLSKASRKLLRKARHRLRSQGVEVIEAKPVAGSTRRAASDTDRFQAAHISTPDFRGARVGYLVDSHPAGGARLFEVRFDEARGILDFKIYNAGRSKVRGFLRSLAGGSEQRLFPVDRDALRALVRRASAGQPVDRPLPTSFVEWRSRLFPSELESHPTPGEIVRTTLGVGSESQDVEITLSDIREGRLGPWPPATSWVGEWMTSGRKAVDGISFDARAGAIDAWLGEVSEALMKETDPVLLRHHLEEMAWVRWQSDAELDARRLLEISDLIAEDDAVMKKMSRARAEGLFANLLSELRVVEESGLDANSDSAQA